MWAVAVSSTRYCLESARRNRPRPRGPPEPVGSRLVDGRNQQCGDGAMPCRAVPFRPNTERAHLPGLPRAAARAPAAPAFTPARAAYTNQPTFAPSKSNVRLGWCHWHSGQWPPLRSPLACGWFRVRRLAGFAPMIFEFESRTGSGSGRSRRLLGLGCRCAVRVASRSAGHSLTASPRPHLLIAKQIPRPFPREKGKRSKAGSSACVRRLPASAFP